VLFRSPKPQNPKVVVEEWIIIKIILYMLY